jgi:hypothetical protein
MVDGLAYGITNESFSSLEVSEELSLISGYPGKIV